MQETCFSFLRCGFDVDSDDILRESWQKSRLDQRRFAATRWAVDQSDRERVVGIGFFDPRLPEPQAVRQTLAIAGARQQFQKEVGVAPL